MKIKAVIFDMDGLMIDSEPIHLKAYNKAMKSLGVILSFKDYSKYLGISDIDISKDIIKRFKLNISKEELMKKKDVIYKKLLKRDIIPKLGLVDLVKKLKNEGYLLAVASSSHTEEILIVLSTLNLKSFFKEIVSADNVKKAKPSPDIFLLTAKKLNVIPEDCLVLEDSSNGVIASKKAKMYCYAIPSVKTNKDRFILADRVLNNLNEVYDLIKGDF